MLTDQPRKRIVIVGDGLATWLTASALARALKDIVSIDVVSTGLASSQVDYSLGAPTVAETSLPSMAVFNNNIGYNENGLIAVTHSGFTLGTAISSGGKSVAYFNSFGETGSPFGPVSFQQLLLHVRALGQVDKYANYALAALCAQAGRFTKPSSLTHPVVASMDYGLQIDVLAYMQIMKADAQARGARTYRTSFKDVVRDTEGTLEAVITLDGTKIQGDLFIDCSGPARRLASLVHESKFVDWRQWLPCSRISHTVIPTQDTSLPYACLTAESNGWMRTISLREHRVESRCVSAPPDLASAEKDLAFELGQHTSPWQLNCVALGGAAATIDPSSSMQLHLLHSAIERLIALIPNDHQCVEEAAEFNRQSSIGLACALDYAIAHYKLNDRLGEPFWDTCRNMGVPETLTHRINVYRNCGRVAQHDDEFVGGMNWVALFDACGIQPAQYNVLARAVPTPTIHEHLTSIRQVMLNTVSTLPTYGDYLKQLQATA